jgi:hypothetical protein
MKQGRQTHPVPDRRWLIPADLALRSYQNQPRTGFLISIYRPRGAATNLKNPKNRRVSREHANTNRENHREAENQRHEQRGHSEPSLKAVIRCRQIDFRICGFFNLPALTAAASDN